NHASDRPRGGRRDRGDRKRAAAHHRGNYGGAQGGFGGDGRSGRGGGGDVAGAGGGIRSGGVLPRDDGNPLPAVRTDNRVFGGDLRIQRADADAGALGALSGAHA